MDKPFGEGKGANKLRKGYMLLLILFLTLFIALLISREGIIAAAGFFLLPFIVFFLVKMYSNPKLGIYAAIFIGFFAIGLTRYVKGVPFGLSMDGLLILTYLILFIRNMDKGVDWSPANKDLSYLALIWFGYSILELFNPEAISRAAWFYAMRGISFYMVLLIPLTFMLMRDTKDFYRFFYIWGGLSILGTLKGLMQQFMGPDPFEQAWLDGGGHITHVLFGKLRIFSFYSDAGQFGASQAHAGLIGSILAMNTKNNKERMFFGTMGLLGFLGMFLSGTRGAIAVPAAGFFLYIILIKNYKILAMGILSGIALFVFFKYTTIGQDNYHIRRMRTAFDPNDASLQVRLENQRKLASYLKTRPLGGGIGSAGNWGQRFSPNGFLANVPTDSWYVQIWAEQGIIGLSLHLFILFFIVIKASYIIMFKIKNKAIRIRLMALASGVFGIMGASYGNGVLGQNPTGPLIYISMAFLFMGKDLDEQYNSKTHIDEPQKRTLTESY